MIKIEAENLFNFFIRLYIQAFWKARGVEIDPASRVLYASNRLMDLGPGTHIGPFSIIIASISKDCNDAPLLKVGEFTHIGSHVDIRASGGLIVIGSKCLIASGVTIVSSNHGLLPDIPIREQPWTRGDILIGDDVWIGAGVTVLPGCQIGRGAIVGAGAVVRGTVDPYEIVAGVPAKRIGSRQGIGDKGS